MIGFSKRLRVGVAVILVLYGLITLYTYTSDTDPKRLFSMRYKLNRSLNEIDLKSHGQGADGKLPSSASLREQLAYQFPYEPEKPMPKYIWQTWKVDVDDPKFPTTFRHYVQHWKENNPEFAHKVLPDLACHELISMLYSSVPDVVKAYKALPRSILKADFFRYLIVYARGGVYSDIDTFDLKGVSNWPSYLSQLFPFFEKHKINPKDVGLVVGIEADPDRPDWAEWYARRIQFCQWTIQAKKGHPLLGNLVNKITEITLKRIEDGTLNLAKGKDEGSDIMNWTGPGIFTDEIFNYLNNVVQHTDKRVILNDNIHETEPVNGLFDSKLDAVENSKAVNWKLFTGMQTPILVDDVLVLPITSFSPGVGQMGAGDESEDFALVKHMFRGTWKGGK